MIKYLKISLILFKNSWIRDSKIPGYILSSIGFQLAEITITLVFFNVLFSNTTNIAGWNFYQILFLYAFAKTIMSSHSYWTKMGLRDMASDLVRTGGYDFYLTKPVSPLLLVSISKPRAYGLVIIFFELILAVYAFIKSGVQFEIVTMLWFLILALCGFCLYYFLFVITIAPVFWFIRLWGLQDIMNRLSQFMRYPAGILPPVIKIGLLTIFPVLTATYIPARILFFGINFRYIMYMLVITIIFGVLSTSFWNFAQKRYASASS